MMMDAGTSTKNKVKWLQLADINGFHWTVPLLQRLWRRRRTSFQAFRLILFCQKSYNTRYDVFSRAMPSNRPEDRAGDGMAFLLIWSDLAASWPLRSDDFLECCYFLPIFCCCDYWTEQPKHFKNGQIFATVITVQNILICILTSCRTDRWSAQVSSGQCGEGMLWFMEWLYFNELVVTS